MKASDPQNRVETSASQPADQIATRRRALAATTNSIWEPPATNQVTTDAVLAHTKAPTMLAPDREWKLIALILRPIRPEEGHQLGNEHREQELRDAFGALNAVEAFQMRRRLELDSASDKLALAFRRLVPERRRRLIAFLADPKRRAANRTRG
jgi:hypothetical protein